MTTNFYDKVAKKFGGYAYGKSHVKHLTEYPNGDPEKIFKKKLIGLANKNKISYKLIILFSNSRTPAKHHFSKNLLI